MSRKFVSTIKKLYSSKIYEAENVKTGMNSVTLQPHFPDQVFMPHMKAMYVPFLMGYSGLICYKGLQSERPKCLSVLVEASWASVCKAVSKTSQFDVKRGSVPASLPVIWLFL